MAEDGRDPLFQYEDSVFADEDLLKISHIPGSDRIVGRNDEMSAVANALSPAIRGKEPEDVLIFGKTGTGKTLVSRAVTQRMAAEAHRDGFEVEHVFLDCGEHTTETSVVKRIAQELNKPISGVDVPDSGLSLSDYYTRLWQVLDNAADTSIIILDEIDMLESDEILRKVSRAGENERVSTDVGVIGISNKIDYPEQFNERVKSSFDHDEIVFEAYDADQLIAILENRRAAFKEGVLEDDAIPLTAAIAAQDHGDARKAIDILRNAGRIARDEEADRVTTDHVEAAKAKTEADRFSRLIEGSPTQAKAILYALARLHEKNPATEEFETGQIYQAYEGVVDAAEIDCLSERRVQEILQEQDFLNVIQSDRRGRGRGRGVTSFHRLLEDVEVVLTVLKRDSTISRVIGN